MSTYIHDAARADALGRLTAYRTAHTTLHDDIVRAAELGIAQADIARASGLSRHGVAKILRGRRASDLATHTTTDDKDPR